MKGEAGFTLVELLAALVAGGLLLALVGAMTGGLGRQLQRADQDQAFAAVAAAAPILRNLIAAASPAPNGFDGSDRHIEAVVAPPMAIGAAGPLKMQLDIVRASDGVALDVTLDADDNGGGDPRLPIRRTLLRGFRAIAFDYDADPVDQADSLPDLVRIELTDPRGAHWTIAAAPRLNAAGGCKFDPISLACRQ